MQRVKVKREYVEHIQAMVAASKIQHVYISADEMVTVLMDKYGVNEKTAVASVEKALDVNLGRLHDKHYMLFSKDDEQAETLKKGYSFFWPFK